MSQSIKSINQNFHVEKLTNQTALNSNVEITRTKPLYKLIYLLPLLHFPFFTIYYQLLQLLLHNYCNPQWGMFISQWPEV